MGFIPLLFSGAVIISIAVILFIAAVILVIVKIKKGEPLYGHPRTKAENVPAYHLFLRCDNAAVQPLDIAYPRHCVAFVYVCNKIN